jgi:hypothetical protein
MPPRGEHGEHFIFSQDKADKVHTWAWCKSCIHATVTRLSGEDTARRAQDSSHALRSRAELQVDGEFTSHAPTSTEALTIERYIAKEKIKKFVSKPERLIKHLKECEHVPVAIRAKFAESTGPAAKRQKTQATFEVTTKVKWDQEKTEAFNQDLTRAIVSTNIPFNVVTNPAFQQFLRTWAADPPIASRQVLSGRHLKKLVRDIENKAQTRMKGKLGMGQCDGWKNVAKTSIVATMVTIENQVRIFCMI